MCAFSCKTILLKKFNANQKFNFKTKEAYVEYLKANKFDTEMFIYPDSASYLRFIGNIESATVYYNSFVSDSISIKKSEFLSTFVFRMGDMIIKSNTMVNCKNAKSAMTNFW